MSAVNAAPARRLMILAAACVLLALLVPAIQALPGGAPERALVRRSPEVEAALASGAIQVLEEYAGGLLLVRGAGGALTSPAFAAAPSGPPRPVVDAIQLAGRTIDTTAPRLAAPPAASGRLELLQFHGPPKAEWLAGLRSAGSIPIAYVPNNAYIVWAGDPAGLAATALPVRWRESFALADRLSPALAAASEPMPVTVTVARAGDHDAAIAAIEAIAIETLLPATAIGSVSHIRVRVPPAVLASLASIPEVVWIEPFESPVLSDERTALIAAGAGSRGRPGPPGYLAWLEAHGMTDLSDQIVDVADTGIGTGDPSRPHPGLAGRVAYSFNGTAEAVPQDCPGHGTNMAGIIAGGATLGNSLRDPEGYLSGLGVAPTVRVGASRIFLCDGQFTPAFSFPEIVAAAARQGARISNNSWGGSGPQYNTITREYDALVRDADGDPSNGDQGFLPIFSVGNRGPGPFTIGWPATAKNVITVGATEGYRPSLEDGCGAGGADADNADFVIPFSSRGPTGDGRIKPDLVAPGTHVQSLASDAPGYTGIGVCDPWFPPSQRLLNWASGTSQAAAHVSGAAAIATAFYERLYGARPSPAMLKAMLINHASNLADLTGSTSAPDHRPSMIQGWGRVNIGALLESQARVVSDQETILRESGERVTFDPVLPSDPALPVVVTLVWTDAPGSPAGWSFVNDLDLVVEDAANTWYGNSMERGVSLPGRAPDTRNNVEVVILPPGSSNVTIHVEATTLAGDGVPSVAGETDQDFALYVSNARHPGPSGEIGFDSAELRCGDPLGLILAARSARGLGRVLVRVTSGADQEFAALEENPPATGLFRGSLATESSPASPGDGRLQVASGDQITASWSEPDPATGQPAARSARLTARCTLPAISDLRVTSQGDTTATITWRTDRPADSQVVYGPGPVRDTTLLDSRLVNSHSVRLTGLSPCTFHTAAVSSTDASGLRGEGPADPLRFSTGSAATRRTLFRDDMEALATRWTHLSPGADSGAVDDWELGFPPAAFVPSGGFSGRQVWGTRLDGPYSTGSDSALTSPPIDLRDAVSPRLTFQHYVAINGAQPPASMNDGAWLEISSDDGAHWSPIDPVGGYPDTVDPDNPWLPTGARVYAGFSATWSQASFDLAAWAGSVVRFRFRLWQDSGENRLRYAGWYVDDVTVTAESACHQGRITLEEDEVGCSSRFDVTLSDSDLDTNGSQAGRLDLIARAGAASEQVTLVETGPGTGEFRGEVRLSPVPVPGLLLAREGETVTVEYADLDDGGGRAATVTAAASVVDCQPPDPPVSLQLDPGGPGELSVSWLPPPGAPAPDLQGYRIHYDSDAPGPVYSGTGAVQGSSPVRHGVSGTAMLGTAGGCAPYFVSVTAFDRFGNESSFAPEALGLPGGSTCALGRITASPRMPGCGESVALSVADQNADGDPAAAGSIQVVAISPSHPGPFPIALAETTAASGLFTGSLAFSTSTAAGRLTVSPGDEVVIQYDDQDDGLGSSRQAQATVTITDCAAPSISDVRLTDRGADRLVVRWTTDEPATSRLEYGPDASLPYSIDSPPLVTDHAIQVAGLTGCAPFHFAITSADARGNVASAAPGYVAETFVEKTILADDFESGAPGWTHGSLNGSAGEWELGAPDPAVPEGPPAAFSGGSVWGTDLDGLYDPGADMFLVSPEVSLPESLAATFVFHHWYAIESSGPPNGFDDGAFLEISVDGGPWTYLPHGDPATCVASDPHCYTDRIENTPYTPPAAAGWAGTSGGWVRAVFPLDPWAGHRVRIRFHLVQDRNNVGGRPRAGWYVDSPAFLYAVACHAAIVSLDRGTYACGADTVAIDLLDNDLDISPSAADIAEIVLTSGTEPSGERVAMSETGPSTSIFRGSIPIASTDSPGTLQVGEGDALVASYLDDDGMGGTRIASAGASVLDCAAPTIFDLTASPPAAGSTIVRWKTSEPADSSLLYGPTPAYGSTLHVPGLRTAHEILLQGLPACTPTYFTALSADAGGNVARDDASAGPRVISGTSRPIVLKETFETDPAGWSHSGGGDTWSYTALGSGAPASGPGVAATSVAGLYTRDRSGANALFSLVSPVLSVRGFARPRLRLEHAWDFPTTFQGDDGAWVEGWNGSSWIALTPDGGYPAFVDVESNAARLPLPGFAGTSSGFVVSSFDLSALASASGGFLRIRLNVFVEGGLGPTGAGWKVADVEISGEAPCEEGRLAFQRPRASCATAGVALQLHDRGLDGDPRIVEQVTVTAWSSGGPAPLQIALTETAGDSGLFHGQVPLSAQGTAGTLRAADGDTLTASYDDADHGSGQPGVVTDTIPVIACSGPRISDVTFTPAGTDGVVAAWHTDRPSSSEASLAGAGGTIGPVTDPRLTTTHRLLIPGVPPCSTLSATLSSADEDDLRTTLAAPAQGLVLETTSRQVLFSDDMEGSDPGWSVAGQTLEWQRGVATAGPSSAYSGTRVWGVDLSGLYNAGANETLTSPPIDLRGRASARLTLWHWYDIFGSEPPNSFDDSAWVEVVDTASGAVTYIEPLGGYPDATDQEAGLPLPEGTPAYSGLSREWERAEFDLTPFAGRIIRLRFRLWNDFVEVVLVGQTGFGWYLDDVEVASASWCHPAPTLTAPATITLLPGGPSRDITLQGTGIRQGATVLAGPGITVSNQQALPTGSITATLSADPRARPGNRDLTVRNPDGQTASAPSALRVAFNPARADLNGSGKIDTLDLILLSSAFGTSEGDAGWSPEADLNSDGYVDGLDLALMAAHFGNSP